jgi:hypothetical protein
MTRLYQQTEGGERWRLEPEMGFEPMTPRLRIACSAGLSYSGAAISLA